MFRLFAAIAIPDDIRTRLHALGRGVSGASWRPIENYHITLRFFGDLPAGAAQALDEELAAIDAPQMELMLSGTGWYGGQDPQSLWAGVAANPALTALAGKCERAARRVGLPPEKRGYRPHVTLAYCHGTPVDQAIAFQARNNLLSLGPIWVESFALYSSWLGRGPSRYVPESDYPLGPMPL